MHHRQQISLRNARPGAMLAAVQPLRHVLILEKEEEGETCGLESS
jgi:hypothetical protein